MDAAAVPFRLRERLGPEATGGLLHVLDLAKDEWREDVLSLSVDRFERRLAEESSTLRVQIAQSEAALRGELGHVDGRLRQDLSQMELRIIREIGDSRFNLLTWTFAFWIGQVVAMSAIMAAMLRIVR